MQHLALGFVELHEVHVGLLLKPVQVPLNVNLPSILSTAVLSLVSSTNLLRMHFDPTVYIVGKDVKQH